MSESVKTLFTAISPTYDLLNHLMSLNLDKTWRKKAIAMISPRATRNQRRATFQALDLCAGTFDLSLECLRQFPNAQITAVDFSQAMLNAGREKISKEFESGKIKPICADALDLPIESNSIDVIFCGYGIRNLDMTQKGIMEMNRVLKSGGQIIVLEFFRPSSLLGRIFHKTYARHMIPLLGKLISRHHLAYQYLRDSIRGFLTVDEFKNLLQGCNYKDITIKDFFMSVSTAVSAYK